MAFWGVEVKSGRPCTLKSTERKRLHLSQATLGIGNAAARSILQCNVGSKSPVFLCSLSPDKIESCQLHMEFQEAEDVTFSVLGPNTIHLTGYFLGKSTASSQNDDESESYGEDVGNSDMDKGSSDDDYDCGDSFINDDDSSACRLYPSSTDDDEVSVMEWKDKKANRDGNRRRLRKKFQVSDSESDKTSAKPDDSSDGDCVQVRNIEDGLKISTAIALSSSLEIDKPDAECEKAAEATAHSHMTLDTREDKPLPDVKLSPLTKVSKTLSKKRRKKEKSKKSDVIVVDDGEGTQKPQSVQATDKVIEPSSAVLLSENGGDETPLKKRRRKNKTLDETTNVQKNLSECLEKNKKNIDEEAVTTKSLELVIPSNEVVIEEIAREHLDGKVATDGKKVSINYTGKLKDTEKPFQSNLGGPPFRFRLGEKNVIKGLSIGIEGMRVGDKRRLVIPPSLGYAEKGLNEVVPKNAWLVYEVEAVKVR